MTCPTCNSRTRVIDTRAGAPGETRRRHECRKGHRFSTMERVENYIDARVCAETGLFGYANEYRALTAKANKKNASAYFCGHCERWHLTQAKNSTNTET